MELTKGMSELAGIFAADGSMQKDHICFWGNITEDKRYYDEVVSKLFTNEFGIVVNPHMKLSNSVYGFYVCDKDVLRTFSELGFKPGSKTYSVKIPEKIMQSEDKEILAAFLRGYADCDGSLTFSRSYGACKDILKKIHTYPRIQIKSVSFEVIEQMSDILKRLQICHITCTLKASRKSKSDCRLLQISGKSRLDKWMLSIGFNNPVQLTRYEIFKKHGFVPPNTAIAQRRAILGGLLDPWDLYKMAP